MAGIEIQRLIATLEARLDKYEKSLARANGLTDRSFKRIETRGKLMEARLAGIGQGAFVGFIRGAAAGVAPILSVAAAIGTAKAALKEFGDIADNSRAAGLDPEFFQGVAYAAQQSGVGFDEASAALATYSKNAGLAAAQKGKMYSALQALNPELLKNLSLTTSQEERVKLAADAIANESEASRRAALSTALFGDAGAKLAAVFAGGAKGIDEWVSKAKQIGIVVDRDLIARADELGDQFDTASKVLDLQFKEVLVELAPLLTATAQGIADIIRGLRELGAVGSKDPFAGVSTEQLAKDSVDYAMMLKDPSKLFDPAGTQIKYAAAIAELQRREAAAKNPASLGAAPTTFDFRAVLDPKKTTSAFDPGAEDRAKQAIAQAEATKKYIDQLRFENSLIGKTELEQKELTAIREAGAQAGSEQADSIKQLIDQGYEEESRVQAIKDAYAELEDIGKDALHSLVEAFDDGKISGDEFLGILGNIASKLADIALNDAFSVLGGGTSTLGTLISSFFGGKRAGGGPVEAGKAYLVGEKRPELFVPSRSGTVLPSVPEGRNRGPVVNNVYNYEPVKVRQEMNQTGGVDTIIGETKRQLHQEFGRGTGGWSRYGITPGRRRS